MLNPPNIATMQNATFTIELEEHGQDNEAKMKAEKVAKKINQLKKQIYLLKIAIGGGLTMSVISLLGVEIGSSYKLTLLIPTIAAYLAIFIGWSLCWKKRDVQKKELWILENHPDAMFDESKRKVAEEKYKERFKKNKTSSPETAPLIPNTCTKV